MATSVFSSENVLQMSCLLTFLIIIMKYNELKVNLPICNEIVVSQSSRGFDRTPRSICRRHSTISVCRHTYMCQNSFLVMVINNFHFIHTGISYQISLTSKNLPSRVEYLLDHHHHSFTFVCMTNIIQNTSPPPPPSSLRTRSSWPVLYNYIIDVISSKNLKWPFTFQFAVRDVWITCNYATKWAHFLSSIKILTGST